MLSKTELVEKKARAAISALNVSKLYPKRPALKRAVSSITRIGNPAFAAYKKFPTDPPQEGLILQQRGGKNGPRRKPKKSVSF